MTWVKLHYIDILWSHSAKAVQQKCNVFVSRSMTNHWVLTVLFHLQFTIYQIYGDMKDAVGPVPQGTCLFSVAASRCSTINLYLWITLTHFCNIIDVFHSLLDSHLLNYQMALQTLNTIKCAARFLSRHIHNQGKFVTWQAAWKYTWWHFNYPNSWQQLY